MYKRRRRIYTNSPKKSQKVHKKLQRNRQEVKTKQEKSNQVTGHYFGLLMRMERWRDGEMERWRDAKMERCKNGEMERWRDEKMERWRDG